jgi:hypothetical protein
MSDEKPEEERNTEEIPAKGTEVGNTNICETEY